MSSLPQAIYTGWASRLDHVFGSDEIALLQARFQLKKVDDLAAEASAGSLAETEYIFGTWMLPRMGGELLERMPALKAIFYAAGSVKPFVSPDLWAKGVRIHSAWAANAVPVAEWTFAQIILCLKRTWPAARRTWETKAYHLEAYENERIPGAYGSTVGLLSLGMIGRMVAERLQTLDVEVIAYDPFIKAEDAEALGVRLVDLNTLFAEADVVSCHTPWLKETEGMYRREHFASMKPYASFINTARGAVVDEPSLLEVLSQREDLTAILDVTHPEPPPSGSLMYSLPNIVITPHIAGSMQGECRRMARYMIEDYDRVSSGQTPRWQLPRAQAAIMA